MQSKLILSSLFAALLINSINCQQMIQLLTSASNRNSQTSQPSSQPQPQGLSLEQQQQLLQQLAALTAQQQRHNQQQQQQQQQQHPQNQQFFDPNQQPYFGPQGGQAPPQQFFSPQQFVVQPPPQQQAPPPQTQSSAPAINWGKCPQLEPSDKEKMTKASVITKCLESTPLPQNITRESVEVHREQIAACALQSEGWFTSQGAYDFGKAESEIKNKRLNRDIEKTVLDYHKQCKDEAIEKFPNNKSTIIAQIQLYQACMDYFISDVCGIEVNEPEAPQFA